MEQLQPDSESIPDWNQLSARLDDAMSDLDDFDREAILLRYFENHDLRSVGAALGISDDAAQKRVTRALERLRGIFAKRGVTVGASSLAVVISANAVQAAPVGLALAISIAAASTGTTFATATITATKAIVMTALQKTIVTATIAVLAGAGIYEGRQAAHLRGQVQTLRQQNAPLQNRIQALENERDEATNQLARFQVIKSKSAPEESELLRLRSEVTRLRSRQLNLAKDGNDPFTQSVLDLVSRAAELNQHLQERPNRKIPELQLLSENDWLTAAQTAKFGNDSDIRKSLQKLRSIAKGKLPIGSALYSYTSANNGDLPNDLSQLKPFFDQSRLGDLKLDDSTFSAIVNRYKLLQTGNVKNFSSGTWFVVEKAPVDSDYDSRAKFGIGTSVVISTGKGEAGDPDDPLY